MKIKNENIKTNKFLIIKELVKRLFVFYVIIFFVILLVWSLLGIIYKPIKVPDVKNLQEEKAKTIIINSNLKYEIERKPSVSVPKGCIVSQFPEPKSNVKEGRIITLTVSSGEIFVDVPDFRNLQFVNAARLIKNLKEKYESINIRIVNNAYIYSNEVPADYVISQNPQPFSKISDEVKISFLISKGPENFNFIMANVINKNIKNIKPIFDSLKINYNILEKKNSNVDEGTILSQKPDPLTFINRTTNVSFVIAKKVSDDDAENNFSALQSSKKNERFVLIDYIVPGDNLIQVNVKIIIKDSNGVYEIYNKKSLPGERLEFRHTVVGNAVMEAYIDNILFEKKTIY